MYKIIYSDQADSSLDSFINSYKNTFTNLFFDSWIIDFKAIISNYERIGDQFYESIRSVIRRQLTSDIVYWRHIWVDNNFSLRFHERSFLIIIDYTEDEENKARYIENIIFTKK